MTGNTIPRKYKVHFEDDTYEIVDAYDVGDALYSAALTKHSKDKEAPAVSPVKVEAYMDKTALLSETKEIIDNLIGIVKDERTGKTDKNKKQD